MLGTESGSAEEPLRGHCPFLSPGQHLPSQLLGHADSILATSGNVWTWQGLTAGLGELASLFHVSLQKLRVDVLNETDSGPQKYFVLFVCPL